ncbi:iron-sulfur cluster-binding oxidoreductase [Candidatus Moduliflexus flocculans]|uniref:Iron-sulfur cluster-binding oxidoreductase n=1 Tax=Candidatus Moduliflexus flocculans TaxID=1499966 RepID=A0A0S6VTI9_9BACT|nr:iron-sulfur cluster-binding oxidoreductase [Candidatus Moduliflexus flocculans]
MNLTRKIINIDESLCDGCGLCVPSCHEQAIQIVETPNGPKARLVKEMYCDGLGACLGHCPTGALTIEEREAEMFDEAATHAHVEQVNAPVNRPATAMPHGGCPSARMFQWDEPQQAQTQAQPAAALHSELRQWPVQLHLVPPSAPYFKNADLVIAADCVPFAYANFHQEFLKGDGKAVVIGCPKLDDTGAYLQKLTQIVALNCPKSITIVNMEVPCCFGLVRLVQQAIQQAGVEVPVTVSTISIRGEKFA